MAASWAKVRSFLVWVALLVLLLLLLFLCCECLSLQFTSLFSGRKDIMDKRNTVCAAQVLQLEPAFTFFYFLLCLSHRHRWGGKLCSVLWVTQWLISIFAGRTNALHSGINSLPEQIMTNFLHIYIWSLFEKGAFLVHTRIVQTGSICLLLQSPNPKIEFG